MTASPIAAATVSFNPETRLYIDGQLRDASGGRTADNLNPATEETFEKPYLFLWRFGLLRWGALFIVFRVLRRFLQDLLFFG